MNAAPDIVAQVRAAGGRIMMVEDRLKVRAPSPLPDELVVEIKQHKVEITDFLRDRKSPWAPDDWRAFFDERAAITEMDGGLSRAEAEDQAYKCCVVEWLNHNPAPSEAGRCAWCKRETNTDCQVMPFGMNGNDHTWLHTSCWPAWL